VDALAVLRQAQHLNADSMPGKPVEPVDIENHVQRVKKALEQTLRDEPVDVSDIPQPRFEADETRLADMARRARELAMLAEDVRKDEGLAKPPEEPITPSPTETEAPAAESGARTEPPPPRGSRPGEAAGAEAPDPVRLAAEKFVAERPDMLLKVGDDAEGKPILKTTKEFLDEARQAAADAREDVGLFEAAAQCLLGRA
jgi:hypothetical protein